MMRFPYMSTQTGCAAYTRHRVIPLDVLHLLLPRLLHLLLPPDCVPRCLPLAYPERLQLPDSAAEVCQVRPQQMLVGGGLCPWAILLAVGGLLVHGAWAKALDGRDVAEYDLRLIHQHSVLPSAFHGCHMSLDWNVGLCVMPQAPPASFGDDLLYTQLPTYAKS